MTYPEITSLFLAPAFNISTYTITLLYIVIIYAAIPISNSSSAHLFDQEPGVLYHRSGVRKDHGYLAATANHLGSPAICVGGVADHVHVVCSLGRTLSVATVVAKPKVSSNLAVRERYLSQFSVFAAAQLGVIAPRFPLLIDGLRPEYFLSQNFAFQCKRLFCNRKMGQTLFEKVWNAHAIRELPNGQTQLLIGTHLIHEVTSPQAFAMLRDLGLSVPYPGRTFATVDHIVPTDRRTEPFSDPLADEMIKELRKNCEQFGITYFDIPSGKQGIVHVVGPEQGITQPGTTIACGDSHTSTHGAFGAIAFGIGTSQVRDVLATQTMAIGKLKVRRINVYGKLPAGTYAKDVILHLIRKLGVNGGNGFAYEYGGEVFDGFTMEERMTVCNMSIEGGARIGYVNPDETTYAYLEGRPYSPKGADCERAVSRWKSYVSDSDCVYDDVVNFDAAEIEPTVTWGINPGQAVFISERLPVPDGATEDQRVSLAEALEHMKLRPGQPIKGTPIQVAFLGSCTNGRLSDFREVAKYIEGRHVARGVKAIAVPGSQIVGVACKKLGIDRIFTEAGFEWREAGCSMCLAMNPDKLVGDQLCASSSNRNFKGRQGSPTGRTVLMSPVMVAAAAIAGEITDARQLFAATTSTFNSK